MTRVKRGFVARKRRARVLKLAKGFRGSHSVLFRTAQQRTMRALSLSYSDRRQFKRAMRQLWIRRLNSFLRISGPFEKGGGQIRNYSGFIHSLKKSHIAMNRKVLSQLAVFDPAAFIAVTNIAAPASSSGT
jgi:large subunit ribosomal protein L20